MAHAQLEIIAAAFEAATQEMAASLVRTAFSPNIKERAGCSTAVCDARPDRQEPRILRSALAARS